MHSPCGLVGDPDVACFPRLYHFGEGSERFFNRYLIRLDRSVKAADAEKVGLSLRPVHLVEVHVVGAEALQSTVYRAFDTYAVKARSIVARANERARPRDLACNDEVIAIFSLCEPIADVAFGQSLLLFHRLYRIHFRGIDEINPLRHRIISMSE